MDASARRLARRGFLLGGSSLCVAAVATTPALAGAREDVVRALVRLKSSIETGVSFVRFMQLIQELDEAAQLAEVTKSSELSALEVQAVKLVVIHLARIAKIWNFVNGATHCRDYADKYKLDDDCAFYLKTYLREIGTTLEKLSIGGTSVKPGEIVGALLNEANKQVIELIDALAPRR